MPNAQIPDEPMTFADRRAARDPSVDHSSHSMQWVGDQCPECPAETVATTEELAGD